MDVRGSEALRDTRIDMGVLENPLLAAAGFVVSFLVLIFSRWKCGGTTLLRPWVWLIVATGTPAIVESLVWLQTRDPATELESSIGWIAASRFVGAASLLLPVVSLLGAKRPQDRAWHLIVLSLWVVLVLPAAESYLLRSGGSIQIHDARGWFLWILVFTGLVNYLPTKHWLACLLFAAAQIAMLAGYLPLLKSAAGNATCWPALSAFLVCSAVGLCAASAIRNRNDRPLGDSPGNDANNRKFYWQAFCDSFGFLWGMRVAERVNALSGRSRLRLDWRRIVETESNGDEDADSVFQQNYRSHLLRFVDDDWL